MKRPMLWRLIRIVGMLRDGRRVQCGDLAAEFEVSLRTIMRDIDYLTFQCDLPIIYDAQKGTYRFTQPVSNTTLEAIR